MKIRVKKKSLIYKFLTITLYRSNDLRQVSKSRFMYGMDGNGYYLRVLGFINGFFRLYMIVKDASQEEVLTKEELENKFYVDSNYPPKPNPPEPPKDPV